MEARFVGQPHQDSSNLAEFLREVLEDAGTRRIVVVTAWAKRSGLGRVRDLFVDYRRRGGESALILGIDEFGATIQGLGLAVELFDVAHVFHEVGAITFHPKFYIAEADRQARLFVGSNNLTAGGLFRNYEAALDCQLDLTRKPDLALMDEVNAYIDRLLADQGVCRRLTPDLVEALVADDRYHIRDEDYRPNDQDGVGTEGELEDEEVGEEHIPNLFGSSSEPKRSGPRLPAELAPRRPSPERPARPRLVPAAAAPPEAEVVRRWFKGPLKHTDAQIPWGPASNVTGNLRLAQAGHPIDQSTYFRDEFFAGAVWAPEPGSRGVLEVTTVPFEVEIDGVNYGEIGLRVDHAEYRIAGQNNVPTVLKWGEQLSPVLRARPYTGNDYVVLERLRGGRYRLRITTAPGGFIR